MPAVAIRKMKRENRAEIAAILQKTPEFTADEVRVALELIDDYLKNGRKSGYFISIAVTDSTVAGYICYGIRPLTSGSWDIYWAAVHPDLKGKGIGRLLFTAAEEHIRRSGGRIILIETSSKPGYEGTISFHHSMGYKDICSIEDFYSIGDHLLMLIKRIQQ